jgi:hypothetical protein
MCTISSKPLYGVICFFENVPVDVDLDKSPSRLSIRDSPVNITIIDPYQPPPLSLCPIT